MTYMDEFYRRQAHALLEEWINQIQGERPDTFIFGWNVPSHVLDDINAYCRATMKDKVLGGVLEVRYIP